ncbi:MAG TPA: hypothetical protein VGB88_00405, partial [Alphaproteobacteria bacterium]
MNTSHTAKLAAGRILSIFFVVGGWLIAGGRAVLDLIGYATLGEDAKIAEGLLARFLDWLISLPWWAPWGFALTATVLLIWASWPKSAATSSLATTPTQPDPPAATIAAITDLIKQIRLQEKQNLTRRDTEKTSDENKYDAQGLGYLILLQQVGTNILHKWGFKNDVEYGIWVHQQDGWIKNAEYVLRKYFKDEDYNWFSTLGVFDAPSCQNPYNADHSHKYSMHWERLRRIGK